MIKLLFIGDIVGFPGLDFVCENLQSLVEKYKSNFVVVNGENICNGKGITEQEATKLFELGTNVITTGNHIWENWISKPLLKSNNLVLRPYNYPSGNMGKGYAIVKHSSGIEICVIQIQGRIFMQPIDCPFRAMESILGKLKNKIDVIIVDFHAEATSEKVAMAHYLDGRISALIGTHTHIQTADAQIMPKGTAYLTDVGMSGPYDSVLGLRTDVALNRHLYQTAHKYESATNDNKICGVTVDIDEESGRALKINNFIFPEFKNSADY
jgi:metallophosphoesterase (TIGR00282 family)